MHMIEMRPCRENDGLTASAAYTPTSCRPRIEDIFTHCRYGIAAQQDNYAPKPSAAKTDTLAAEVAYCNQCTPRALRHEATARHMREQTEMRTARRRRSRNDSRAQGREARATVRRARAGELTLQKDQRHSTAKLTVLGRFAPIRWSDSLRTPQ